MSILLDCPTCFITTAVATTYFLSSMAVASYPSPSTVQLTSITNAVVTLNFSVLWLQDHTHHPQLSNLLSSQKLLPSLNFQVIGPQHHAHHFYPSYSYFTMAAAAPKLLCCRAAAPLPSSQPLSGKLPAATPLPEERFAAGSHPLRRFRDSNLSAGSFDPLR